MKVVAILYKGGEAAKQEPRLLGTVENELGIRSWLESLGHTYLVSDDKEGPDSFLAREIVDVSLVAILMCGGCSRLRFPGRHRYHHPFPPWLHLQGALGQGQEP